VSLHVGLVGAPNAGKTTLFNRLTGQRAKVGNYPGVTVERHTGHVELHGAKLEIVDLPGTYSLAPRSEDEAVTLRAVLGTLGGSPPDVLVCVVDASQLPRSLYLAAQLLELARPFVVALTMLDVLEDDEVRFDRAALEASLGVPVVDARDTAALAGALARAGEHAAGAPGLADLDDDERARLVDLGERLARVTESAAEPATLGVWLAHASVMGTAGDLGLDGALVDRARRCETREQTLADVVAGRYERIEGFAAGVVTRTPAPTRSERATARVDRLLLHPVGGPLAFLSIFLVLFSALFSWAAPLMDAIDALMGLIGDRAGALLPESLPLLRSLVLDGVIAGVGNVVVFLPQIAILFFFLGVLEDSGYLARAAFLLDRLMVRVGLSGRAFVPLLSGFACAVPAILATRTLANPKDRLLTILVTPLVSCSARLPVYALMIATVFAGAEPVLGLLPVGALLMIGMYVLSIVAALGTAAVFRRTLVRAPKPPLLLELPLYRAPRMRNVLREVSARSRVFLTEAGTVILAITIILWGLFTFPRYDAPEGLAPEAARAAQLEQSVAGRVGQALEPAFEPLGYDWKIGVGLIASFAAREVLVSTLGLVYGLGDVEEDTKPLRQALRAEKRPDGSPRYTPLVGLSLMVFFVLAMQCMSTMAAVKRETRSWKWPLIQFGYMSLLAYVAALVIYQGGRALGLA
jgi:ferrous iron transport protein B